MKKTLSVLLTLCMLLALAVPALTVPTVVSAASTNIKMIVTNPGEIASTQMNIGFHAPTSYKNCYVQYTTTDDTSWAKAKTNSGTYTTYGTGSSNPFYGKSAVDDSGTDITQSVTFNDYNVNLTGLTPDTNYMYRIYDGSAYSNTYYFKTAANDGSEWSFLVTGDFHEFHASYGAKRAAQATKGINAGISLANQLGWAPIEHIASVGDIVAWGVGYNQWQNVFNQPWMSKYSFANAIGNHDDMDRSSNSTSQYNSIVFNNPLNGYNSGYEMGTVFYYIYNNVLFIYVNYLKASVAAQETWAQSVIDNMKGQYQYAVLVNHRPATNKYTGGTYSYFWNYWADFCDKNHIDLVLAGDHHVYMRSQPLYNGSKVSGYSASNPNATVYLAADSTDGERGSSTDVSSFNSSYVASSYYRYDYSGSTKDITTIIINVTPTKMTTQFVYYENSSSASHPSWKVGSVSGHSSFYYGDTSYVYPSDHGYDPDYTPPEPNTNIPVAAKNYFSASNGGTYMYPTNNYPGTASYYTTAYYGDNSNQGGSYFSGKLNNNVYPADSNPGSSNADWATFFNSMGTPDITMKLSETIYLNNIALVYRNGGGFYIDLQISSVSVSTDGINYSATRAYSASKGVHTGSNSKLTLQFEEAVQAKYIKVVVANTATADSTRYAIGEIEVWGDTKLPEGADKPFELVEDSEYSLDTKYVVSNTRGINAATVIAEFQCEVTVLDASGKVAAESAVIGTGFSVVKYDSDGEVVNSVILIVPGDLTGDSLANATDLLITKDIASGNATATEVLTKAADLNGDALASTADVLTLQAHCAGTTPLD